MAESFVCPQCGRELPVSLRDEFDGRIMCESCLDSLTVVCDNCEALLWREDNCGNRRITLCEHCRNDHYSTCSQCGRLCHNDELHYLDEEGDDGYCDNCYESLDPEHGVQSYYYKPDPIFYGAGNRFMGVELEIDEGGELNRNAARLMAIANQDCDRLYLKVDRELRRCNNDSIEALERVNRSTILLKFPVIMPKKATTTLVLKAPKTESSNRIIYLPGAVIEELRKVRAQQLEAKALLGEEYRDYDLVVAQLNGRPYEQRGIDKMFYDLIEKNSLRPVVFHSLRHSSTSLKLKLSRGNIKAVQGDTGHAEARMVTDTYAHGFDADRKLIAQEMDSGFFAKVGQEEAKPGFDADTVEKLKLLIQQNPELLNELLKGTNQGRKTSDKTA